MFWTKQLKTPSSRLVISQRVPVDGHLALGCEVCIRLREVLAALELVAGQRGRMCAIQHKVLLLRAGRSIRAPKGNRNSYLVDPLALLLGICAPQHEHDAGLLKS